MSTSQIPNGLPGSPSSCNLQEIGELLPYLTEAEIQELTEHLSHLPLWTPQPGPQTTAFQSDADILGYGGAAGGGKTDLLLGLALTRHQKSVIFRREATTLRDIVFRSQALLAGLGSFNGATNVWRDLPNGRTLELAGIKDPKDVFDWRGRPHDAKLFDEATEFLEKQFRLLIAWNRTTVPGQRCRVVACFNPPTEDYQRWVISFWAPWLDETHHNPAAPGELRYYAQVEEKPGETVEIECKDGKPFEHKGKTIRPLSRTFIPASLEDNAFLRDTDYAARLESLPEPYRSAWRWGNFKIGVKDDPRQLIPTAWVKAAQARWKESDRARWPLSAVGVDVARGGAAKTVLARRRRLWFDRLLKYPGVQTNDGQAVRQLIVQTIVENRQALVCIDSIGIGSAAVDLVRECRGIQLFPVNFAQRTSATDKSGLLGFANLRAFAFWSLKELLDPANDHRAALPPDAELLSDLTAIRWEVRAGLIMIEAKEKIAARLGRSPDCADALAYSILTPANDEAEETEMMVVRA